jgi:hypothetical protein
VTLRSWQILTVNDVGGGLFSVVYLLGGTERRSAVVRDIFGLDKALTDMGVYLASQPPFIRGVIGGH